MLLNLLIQQQFHGNAGSFGQIESTDDDDSDIYTCDCRRFSSEQILHAPKTIEENLVLVRLNFANPNMTTINPCYYRERFDMASCLPSVKAKVYIIFVYLAVAILSVESAKKRKRPDMYHAVGRNSKNQHRQR
uniref:Uncharacterized protein n=1 Tax=Glossina austeni TaxID=7395 RepID=A0A1A9UQQ1_GLOAU